ncbi:cupin domain-containing protein [Actinoplanes sp. TBRC 11911]|uniref:cupin domain-containing protein n=1 Tax=Actinoplanes sp. TBRC 11911 TaxID=2729386 RepID=UPI00145D5B09|nr:cupin domain-containing protein [Actinoplanes sp. TBRC 11911]NMO50555.1 cupin domain-containing protein [Actinoplanes sp. TBRC 11911]
MAWPDVPVNFQAKHALFDDYWKPRTVAETNGYEIRVAKFKGEFVWHHHANGDETFVITSGVLQIEMKDRETVTLHPGDLFVVPAGLEHRPVSPGGCDVILLEPPNTRNTGNRTDHDLTTDSPRI